MTKLLQNNKNKIKKFYATRHWCLTPVILATQEGEIRRITAQFEASPGK
jgi:hypothetical protein